MIQLGEGEKILLLLHKHWIVITTKGIFTLLLLLVPLFIIPFEKILAGFVGAEEFRALLFFLTMLYWMIVVGFFLVSWIEYWLDVWVITTERVIDIAQVSLFNREVSEFPLARVQDVRITVPNVMATLLGFGDITVQTAGENSFSMRNIPQVEKAKRIILEQSERYRRNARL